MIRFVLCSLMFVVWPATLFASPPEVPKLIKAKPGQLIRVVVKTDVEIGTLKNFTDEDAFFEELSLKKGERRFAFQAPVDAPVKEYVIGWWTKGETEGVTTTIMVGVGKPVKPPIVDPPVTPPTPTGLFYFLIARADGPASPAYTKSMSDPAWDTLRIAGHKAKDKTASELTKMGYPVPSVLPSVIILREDAESSEVVGSAPFPASSSEILNLPKAVK